MKARLSHFTVGNINNGAVTQGSIFQKWQTYWNLNPTFYLYVVSPAEVHSTSEKRERESIIQLKTELWIEIFVNF